VPNYGRFLPEIKMKSGKIASIIEILLRTFGQDGPTLLEIFSFCDILFGWVAASSAAWGWLRRLIAFGDPNATG